MRRYFFYIAVVLLSSCELIPDLDRDNPNDAKNNANVDSKRTTLAVSKVEVSSKNNSLPYQSVDQNIYAGDIIYLSVELINSGDFDAKFLKGNIISNSNYIQISPPIGGFYLTFEGGAKETILKGRHGFAQITNGQNYVFAPNENSYAVKFSVSADALPNSIIPFELDVIDVYKNKWNIKFEIRIK